MSKSKLRSISLTLAVAIGSAISICSPVSADEPNIKIGLSVQLDLQQGRDGRDGLNLAIKEINAAGGILGRKVESVVVDETPSPEGAANSVRKLLNDDKVDVFMGGTSSGNILASLPAIADAKKVSFIVGAASPVITAKVKEDYSTYKYLFRMNMNSDYQAQAMLDFVKDVVIDTLGAKKIAILADNSKWAQEVTAVLQKKIGGFGAQITAVEVVAPDTLDYNTPLVRIRNSGAQFMVTVLVYGKSDVLAKQYFDTKFPMLYGGMDGMSMDDAFFARVDGKNVGQLTAVYGTRAALTPATIPYFDKFKAEYKRDPGYQAWTLDSALRIYAAAVQRAGSFDTDKVISEIEKTRYVGAGGTVEFDSSHDVKYGKNLMQWYVTQWQQDGSRAIVYPKELAKTSATKPTWIK